MHYKFLIFDLSVGDGEELNAEIAEHPKRHAVRGDEQSVLPDFSHPLKEWNDSRLCHEMRDGNDRAADIGESRKAQQQQQRHGDIAVMVQCSL